LVFSGKLVEISRSSTCCRFQEIDKKGTKESRKKWGTIKIAVELIRKTRDERDESLIHHSR